MLYAIVYKLHDYLRARRVNTYGGIKVFLGGATLHSNGVALRDLARIWSQDVESNNSVLK